MKMQRMIKTLLSIATFCLAIQTNVYAEEQTYWNLPINLSTQNTSVDFEVDSTWHLSHFKVKKINGKVWLKDKKDFNSIQAHIYMPVRYFDSDNSLRDKKMLKVMGEKKYKNVEFDLISINNLCDPIKLMEADSCNADLIGNLKIKETEKQVTIPVKVSFQNNKYLIDGNFNLDWDEYGVEDPSILIAKVYKKVQINFKLEL